MQYDPKLSIHHNLTVMGYTTKKTDKEDSHERHIIKDGQIVFTGNASQVAKWMRGKNERT